MAAIIRRIPGILGVLAAYLALRLVWLLGFQSIAGEIILIVIVYLLIHWLAERALRSYQDADANSPPL
jgi:membrane protein implicated in regulation of membrane protease activity